MLSLSKTITDQERLLLDDENIRLLAKINILEDLFEDLRKQGRHHQRESQHESIWFILAVITMILFFSLWIKQL